MTNPRVYFDNINFENPRRYTWQDSAVCAEIGDEIFFIDKGGSYQEARVACGMCLVRFKCLKYIMDIEDDAPPQHRFGMFAGLTPQERYALYVENGGVEQPLEEIAS